MIEEHKMYKCFNNSKKLFDRSQFFQMIKDKKISALLPKSWKKPFNSGINIPTELRFYDECNNENMCNKGNNQVNEIKEFAAIKKLLNRQAPNEFGHMLPYFKEKLYCQLFVPVHLLFYVSYIF